MGKDYYLGLDIGTGSVGWAVTDENYNICKYKKRAMWGIRLFDGAKTAEERRLKRGSRRRLSRKKQRIDLLQEIFSEEMNKVDPTFFIRLNESRLHMEDKSIKELHPLFIGEEYSDIDYYKEYPTIFHLRKELIHNSNKHDIRLVYLALHNIIKARGHFLIDGEVETVRDFKKTFDNCFTSLCEELDLNIDLDEKSKNKIEEILKDRKLAKSHKSKILKEQFTICELDKKSDIYKRQEKFIEEFCKLLVGNKGNLLKFFGIEKTEDVKSLLELKKNESLSISFSDKEEDYIKAKEKLETIEREKVYLLDLIKPIYDWNVLVDVLQDKELLSESRVEQYETHKENLRNLKRLIKKYLSDEYNKFFNNTEEKEISYSSYVGHLKKNGKKYNLRKKYVSESDFYKSLKEILDKINPEDEDGELLERLKNGVELENLLPIQRGRNNGSIPRQIHEVELKRILENASKYLPFLNEKDSDGYDAKEKIIKIFEFRIPYYVGPLSARHKEDGSNAWVVRKEEGRIYPWNFDKKVDREKSNEEFIARMTNKCTYLLGEDVLPKNSLLYSEYMVLNELNNLSVRGEKIPIETKKDIFNRLFKEKAKVSEKDILEFLKKDFPEIQKEDLGGFKDYFKTSLKSYLDFKKQIFGSDIDRSDNRSIVEDIIKWKTIYDDDKKMIEKVISEKYPDFYKENKEKMGKIHGFRYSGWGNFSYKFLKKIQGCNKNGEEFFGEGVSVITALWETNNNLMQLLSDRYTFKEEVDKSNIGVMGTIDEINYDSLVKDLYVSPANKREIWQTIRIAEEVKKVMGCAPKKIFIEMARGEDDRKAVDKIKSEKGRKEFLKDLYANCEDEEKIWDNELSNIDERDFTSIKLYLYSTQMGKCMYTGEKIDLDELMSGNSKWDRDHIYPQSKIKDDSIDNLVLVNKKYNAKKSNDMLSEDIQKANRSRWKYLYEKGFISKKKYERLNRRTDFTEDELAGFISRQLVETRQATKAVADLFKQIYPKSKIVYVKARLVSDFRKRELDSLKSRLVNDYHHAKDAYLNIVVGNVYNATFTDNIYKWLKENKDSKYSINSVFYRDRKDGNKTVWEFGQKDDKGKITGGTMDVVRSTVEKNNILYTEYSYCEKGELFNEMPKKKGDSAAIPLKSGLRVEKYGGYNSAKTSYFAMVEFDEKKGERVRKILAVPVYISNIMNHNHNAFIEYCEKTKGLINVSVIFSKIKKNSIISTNGFSMRIRGESEPNLSFKNNIQLILDNDSTETIRRIEKLLEKKKTEINEERDGISGEALNDLFEKLIHKFETVYKERPSNPLEQLKKSKEIFESSENLIEKATTIDGIVRMLRCDNETKADLSFIGGKKNTGSMLKNTNALCKNKITIINQSVTGLFEKRIHL